MPNPIQFVLLREFTHLHKKWVMSIHIEQQMNLWEIDLNSAASATPVTIKLMQQGLQPKVSITRIWWSTTDSYG